MRTVDSALQKSILQSESVSIFAIVSLCHFLKGCNHLSSTVLQNKIIIVQLPKINMCFWDFQNHASNGEFPFKWRMSWTMPVILARNSHPSLISLSIESKSSKVSPCISVRARIKSSGNFIFVGIIIIACSLVWGKGHQYVPSSHHGPWPVVAVLPRIVISPHVCL